MFRRDRNYSALGTDRGGGCVALVRDDIRAVRVREFESQIEFVEDLWIKVSLPSSALYICVVYFTPTNDHRRYLEHFRSITTAIDGLEEDARVIITGDYNMSKIEWSCPNLSVEPVVDAMDDSINALLDTMVYTGLRQYNIIKNARNGVLDLVLSNVEIHGIRVSKSDHFLVQEDTYHPTLEINIELNMEYLKENTTVKRNFTKADYVAINDELSAVDWRCIEEAPIERAVDLFYTIIDDIIDRNVPILRPNGRYPYWYSRELIGLLRRKERARTKWKRSGSSDDYTIFSNLRREAKASAESAYDTYLRNLQIDIPNNIKLFWSFSKNKRATNTYPSELSFNDVRSSNTLTLILVRILCQSINLI